MTQELYKKLRPQAFSEVVGQPDAVAMLESMVQRRNVPHALMFTGPSGCGKTTLARIMRKLIGCSDMDFCEINAAVTRGVDDIRRIQATLTMAPVKGRCRVFLIDEAQKLTNEAQNGLLKTTEDTPKHIYFMIATTDPGKLIKPLLTRFTEVKVKGLDRAGAMQLIDTTAELENITIDAEVRDRIIEAADGSARKVMVLLDSIAGIADPEAQAAAIAAGDHKTTALKICQALTKPKPSWKDVAAVIKDCDEDPEGIRRAVLGYCQSILLKGAVNHRIFVIMDCFARPFYDTGKPGLTMAAYDATNAPSK